MGRLYGDRDEMINRIINKCCKLEQKEYKTKHDRVVMVIHWELCKKLKFPSMSEQYMHNSLGFLYTNGSLNTGQKTRRSVSQQKKRDREIWLNSGLYRRSGPPSENQRKRKERQAIRPCQRTEKAIKPEGDSDTNLNWCAWNNPQILGKWAWRGGNRGTSRVNPNYSIVKISQNTEKSPGELRRLTVTQVKDHQRTLVRKTCKEKWQLIKSSSTD